MNRRSLPAALAAVASLLGFKPQQTQAATPTPAKPNLCWNADDWETTYDTTDIYMLVDEMQPGDVMRTGRAMVLPDVWVALDAEGEVHEFTTEAEAEAFGRAVTATQHSA